MGYKLCTAEKPSVAGDIAKVIGATKRCNGYYEGNGYRVTWAVGHLVGLAEPSLYGYMSQKNMWDKENPQNKDKALAELPLIPQDFKLIVLPSTKDQFEIIKSLMNDPECDEIIDCGDAGAEGHILQWFIRVKAGCRKPVKRFMATSMTEEAIKVAFANLQPQEKYMPIIKGEYCKKKADWIMGMSMSRCESITYNAKVDVGRVQSPTLFFVVQRYLAVANFKVSDYYQLQADFTEGFKTFWLKDNKNYFPQTSKDMENRLIDKTLAEKTASEIKQLGQGIITALETKNKATDRPQLYDITELERDGNRLYGYTAEQVLQTAQSLYEKHKITSYPRTDSRYITTDLQPYMKHRIEEIGTQEKYSDFCNKVIQNGLNIDKKIVDDRKVTDHHAIICTEKIKDYDLSKLTEIETNILHLIITRMLVAFSDKYTYKETVINVTFKNSFVFASSGKIPVSMGWKDMQSSLMGKVVADDEEKDNDEEQLFSNVSLNQTVNIKDISVLAKKTTPPKLHTEATLLTAMENAGSQISNGAILKGRGIGTQATRASIIKSLFDKGYIMNKLKGKTNYLIPTKQGISVIKVLPKELYSPKITADWEEQIAQIVDGKLTENQFMDNFNTFIHNKINEVKNQKISGVDFTYDRVAIAKCPWCRNPVYEGKFKDKDGNNIDSAYCSNKECKFSIRRDNLVFKMRTGKNLTTAQLKNLISKGSIETTCISKAKTTYKGVFKLVKNNKGYSSVEFEMPEYKPKKSAKNNSIKW